MKLNLEQIKDISQGVERITENNGEISFFRFTEKEEKLYSTSELYPRTFSTSGVKLHFKTDATALLLKVRTEKMTNISFFAFDIYVKNTSNVPATNVKIKADVHNANLYYKYIFESNEYDGVNMVTYYYYQEDTDNSKQFEEFTIDTLAPGETASFTYQCIADEITEGGEKEIYSSIKVSADDIEETSIETMKNKIKN